MVNFIGNCRVCGYPLLKLPEPRCPECGTVFDPANPATMDFNRPKWFHLLQKPVTVKTYFPSMLAGGYLLVLTVFRVNVLVLQLLAIPALLVLLLNLLLAGSRRRMQRWRRTRSLGAGDATSNVQRVDRR